MRDANDGPLAGLRAHHGLEHRKVAGSDIEPSLDSVACPELPRRHVEHGRDHRNGEDAELVRTRMDVRRYDGDGARDSLQKADERLVRLDERWAGAQRSERSVGLLELEPRHLGMCDARRGDHPREPACGAAGSVPERAPRIRAWCHLGDRPYERAHVDDHVVG